MSLPRWNFRNGLRLGVLGVVLSLAVAIVGFHSHAHSHGDLTVQDADGNAVTVREWKLGEAPKGFESVLRAGELSFTLANADNVAHDFYVVRADGDAGALPTENGKVDLSKIGELVASAEVFSPGESGTLKFGFMPGDYVLFCNQSGHYEHGMYYRFSVE